jgi:hypothetical protein
MLSHDILFSACYFTLKMAANFVRNKSISMEYSTLYRRPRRLSAVLFLWHFAARKEAIAQNGQVKALLSS